MIETTATKQRRSAAEIFLEEWGTMGRKRPTVEILLDLLVKTELFRAADYLAVDVLKGEPPERPGAGPAAAVDIPEDLITELNEQISSVDINSDINLRSTAEADLQDVKYPSISSINYSNNDVGFIEVNFSEGNVNYDHDQTVNAPRNVSDLIKFSSDSLSVPQRDVHTTKNLIEFSTNSVSNNDDHGMVELTSQELPVCILQELPRELKSSELPLCINHDSNSSSNTESLSVANDSMASSSSFTSDSNITDDLSINDIPITVNPLENVIKSAELPLTVMEFCQRL